MEPLGGDEARRARFVDVSRFKRGSYEKQDALAIGPWSNRPFGTDPADSLVGLQSEKRHEIV
jgi:hypothetical protein